MVVDCAALRGQAKRADDTLKKDGLMITEVVLPVAIHSVIFVCMLLRICKLRRASLFYNRERSKSAQYKRWGLLVWAFLQAGMSVLIYLPHFELGGECFDLAVYLEDNFDRLALCLAGAFQVVCILFCYYLLGFEVICKVNPLWSYTRGNFVSCIAVYLISVVGVIVFDSQSASTGLFMYLIYMLRMIVVVFLETYHELNPVNFHSFNDERMRTSGGGPHGNVHVIQGRSVLKRSRGDFGAFTYRLKVLDRVKRQGDINLYVVEVYGQQNRIAVVEKTYTMFKELERDLCNHLRDSEANLPTLERGIVYAGGSESSPGDKYLRSPEKHISSQEELQNIKAFCKIITGSLDFQDGPFFEFFQIQGEKPILPEVDGRSSVQSTDKSRDDSMNMVAQKSGLGWRPFVDEDPENFTLYFKVTGIEAFKADQGHFLYRFKVNFVVQTFSDEDVSMSIEKRYSDFVKLEKQITSKIRPPPLPKKRIIQNETSAQERLEALSKWLNEVTNSKLYHSSDLFDFIELKGFARDSLGRSKPVREIRSVKVSVEGNKSINCSSENVIMYIIRTEVFDTRSQDKAGESIVDRRFRDFVMLHDHLKIVYKEEKKPLPELPSRWTSFSNADQRMQKLNKYIAALANHPFILEVMLFRKFIGMNSDLLQNLGSTQIQMLN